VNEDVTCRLQQLTAENGRLWLFAITQHQNALANAQALQVSAGAARLDSAGPPTACHRPCHSLEQNYVDKWTAALEQELRAVHERRPVTSA